MSLSRSAALARHEVRILLSDPMSFLSLTLMPLLMMAFFKPLARIAIRTAHPGANGAEYTVPAMTTMFAFFLVAFVGFAFFAEHRWNTWERLRASQASNAEILVGKVEPAMALCLVQQVLLFGAGVAFFGLHLGGSLLGVFLVCVALSLCLTSFGILLAALLRTEQQLNALANLGAIVLAGVSGALVPLSLLPGWAHAIAPMAPQYWAMRGFEAVLLDGQGVSAVLLPVAVLSGIAAVAGGLALLRFRFDEPKVVSSAFG
jgi:ABC-2 type transport system permease protein